MPKFTLDRLFTTYAVTVIVVYSDFLGILFDKRFWMNGKDDIEFFIL